MQDNFKEKAKKFIKTLPHKDKPYSKRSWGNSWHSLCSYHGKLKPSLAHFLIKWFTNEGERVLDPLSGVGTIPFEACLQNRIGIGNDLSEVCYIVTKAKLGAPPREDVNEFLNELKKYINSNLKKYKEVDLPYSDFGFNGKIPEYFHNDTYFELLAAREFLISRLENGLNSAEAVVFSSLLHVLHGNRPYALSRRSHPLTPYSPKGDFKYKKVINHIKDKIDRAYKEEDWENYIPGKAFKGDYNDIDSKIDKVDAIVTSPPFTGSIRFYTSNWLRLWLTGWEPETFEEAQEIFLEGKQKDNLDVYYSFFNMCNNLLKSDGRLILHLGKSKTCNMTEELFARASDYFERVYSGLENVESLEKHGVSDKGATKAHQFLFLRKK